MNAQPILSNSSNATNRACAELSAGRCVAIPTETVYGLAADATNGEAIARIFEMKQRPAFNPLICHVDGLHMAKRYSSLNGLAEKLAAEFWPGPLTLVVPVLEGSSIHPLVTAGLETIGLRSPKGIASKLITRFGKPLAAPSANKSGKISPTCAAHVEEEFADIDLLILDNGPCDVGVESTILKVEEAELELLRPGAITAEMIQEVTDIIPTTHEGDSIQAPGMMASHYAPRAKVITNSGKSPEHAARLQFGDEPARENSLNLSPSGDLREAAANLYNFLKILDAEHVAEIYVSRIPEEGLGIAINDRLRRAAAPREQS